MTEQNQAQSNENQNTPKSTKNELKTYVAYYLLSHEHCFSVGGKASGFKAAQKEALGKFADKGVYLNSVSDMTIIFPN